jgi:hypothetical protein
MVERTVSRLRSLVWVCGSRLINFHRYAVARLFCRPLAGFLAAAWPCPQGVLGQFRSPIVRSLLPI